MTPFRGDAFGMELNGGDGKGFVGEGHDEAIVTLGRDFKTGRQGGAFDNERVIARGGEGARDAGEHGMAGVGDAADLAMHGRGRAHNLAAKRLTDGLEAEAHAEQRHVSRGGRRGDKRDADAGAIGIAGAGREHDAGGFEGEHFFHGLRIVADNGEIGPKLGQEVPEIVGEGIVVIDEDKSAFRLRQGFGGQVALLCGAWQN